MSRSPALIPSLVASLALLLGACASRETADDFLKIADEHYTAGNLEAAEIEYRNALTADGQNGHAISRLGILYFEQGRPFEASRYLLAAKNLDPTNAEVRLKLAEALLTFGDRKQATAEAEYLLSLDSPPPEALLILAETALDDEAVAAARPRLEELQARPGLEAAALVALAALDLRSGQLPPAVEKVDQALALKPDFAPAHVAASTLARLRNDLVTVRTSLERAVALSGPRSPNRIRLAQFLAQQGEVEAARSAMQAMTEAAPGYLPAWLLIAQLAADEQKPAEAEAALERIFYQDPAYPEALLLRARLLLAQGDFDRASSILVRAIESFPFSPNFRYQLALAQVAQGKVDDSIATLQETLRMAPNMTDAAVLLSGLELRRGEAGAAVPRLREVLQRQPNLLAVWPMLAEAHLVRNELNEALAIYQHIDDNFPPLRAETAFAKANVHVQLRQPELAEAAYLEALKRNPLHPGALERLTLLYIVQRRPADAHALIDGRLAENPDDGGLHALRSRVFESEGNLPAARAELERALELNPEQPNAYFQLAGILFRTQEEDGAINNLVETLARRPDDERALMMLALIRDRRGEQDQALETYAKLVAVNPRSAVALNNLAYIYSQRGDFENALKHAQVAREVAPTDPNIADTLGWIAYHRGDLRWALTLLQESASRLPESGEAQFHLGAVLYELGREADARTSLQTALGLAPEAPFAAEARQRLAVLDVPVGETAPVLAESVAARPNDAVALSRQAAHLSARGQIAEALTVVRQASTARPANSALMLQRSDLEERNGNTTEALTQAEAAYQLEPANAAAARSIARLALRQGNHTRAFGLLSDLVARGNASPDLRLDYAEAAFSLGRVDLATSEVAAVVRAPLMGDTLDRATRFSTLLQFIARPAATGSPVIAEALAAEPTSAPALFASALHQISNGETAAAIGTLQSLLRAHPEFSSAKRELAILLSLDPAQDRETDRIGVSVRSLYPDDARLAKAIGMVRFRAGNFAQARALLGEAAVQRENDPELAFHLGAALVELNELDAGRQTLNRALELGLPDTLATQARALLARAATP